MRFVFDLIFYPIVFIVIGLFLFYEPVATCIFLAIFGVIVLVGGILLHKHRRKHGYRQHRKSNVVFWMIYILMIPVGILKELLKPTK